MDSILRMVEYTRREMAEAYPPGMLVLRVAVRRGPMSPSDIALAVDMRLSAVIRQLHELEEEGHLTIVGDSNDARACLVAATRAGMDEVRQFDEVAEDAAVAVLANWTAEDVRGLAAAVNRLADDWHSFRRVSASKVRRWPVR